MRRGLCFVRVRSPSQRPIHARDAYQNETVRQFRHDSLDRVVQKLGGRGIPYLTLATFLNLVRFHLTFQQKCASLYTS